MRSMSKAASIFQSPMQSSMQTARNEYPIFLGLRNTLSLSMTINLVQRVSLSSVKPSTGRLFLPNDSNTGVTTRDVMSTKNTLIELIMPTQCIGRIGMTRNDRSDTNVVKPQKNTDHPISLIVSTIALRRSPCMRIRPLK